MTLVPSSSRRALPNQWNVDAGGNLEIVPTAASQSDSEAALSVVPFGTDFALFAGDNLSDLDGLYVANTGRVLVTAQGGTNPGEDAFRVNAQGASRYAIGVVTANGISERILAGVQASPAVPASTVGLVSPFAFPALVVIRGGTVTVIAVDGNTLGVTQGLVLVNTGSTITITYAVVPSWDWYGLAQGQT